MLAASAPALLPQPFANNATGGYVRTIPNTTADSTAASLNLGFPPATFTPVELGGTPPNGEDFNGILNWLSSINQWQQAGGFATYNSAFSTAIGGYPNGAILVQASGNGFWISNADNNSSDPDTGGANWATFGGVPPGTIVAYSASATPPTGYLACPTAASTVLRASYPTLNALYSANGYPYGNGDGTTTFNIPFFPPGYVPVQGAVAVLTHGALLAHTHTTGNAFYGSGSSGAATGTSSISAVTGSTGGTDNLAAGYGVQFCVKT